MKTRNVSGRALRGAALAVVVLAAAMSVTSCQNPSGDAPGVISAFANTVWSDGVTPESTISFLEQTVVLDGAYWEASDADLSLDGKTMYFNEAEDLSADAVEPAVQIWTDVADRKCIELYYYKATESLAEHFDVYGWEQQRRRFFKED